jgi:hypothetical protein
MISNYCLLIRALQVREAAVVVGMFDKSKAPNFFFFELFFVSISGDRNAADTLTLRGAALIISVHEMT